MTIRLFAVVTLFSTLSSLFSQTPEWLWHGKEAPQPGETRFFRKIITVPFPPKDAYLTASGDDAITVYINGKEAGQSDDWRRPLRAEPLPLLKEGANVIAIKGKNGAVSPEGVVLRLEVRSPNNFGIFFVTDKSWLSSDREEMGWQNPDFAPKNWQPAVSLGQIPVQPWGDVFGEPQATPGSKLTVAPNFKVELLRSARADEGSWICMTFDNKGRIIVSPEKLEKPLLRFELGSKGEVKQTTAILAKMRAAMGLCYANDSLYVNGHGPSGVGLYRLKDSNGNDQFDPGEERLLKKFEGDNEHAYHAVLPGPDGMIYVINGNMTKLPEGISSSSPLRNYREELLLPRMWDPTGHARGIMAPGGHVLRTDPEGKQWSLFCGGFRNAYDCDFNEQGELFTFDSDMEYDLGLPWYRPTRVLHCVSGADFGWRSGSGKWPAFYADSLPATVDVGLSSPTGVKFGYRSSFPQAYRKAFFVADWNYGRILAVHLQPEGATYKGKFEPFLSGKPLPVVDLEFGPDGAMYFITGGWRTQSGLYRVSYTGKPETPTKAEKPQLTEGTRLRRKLEQFHGKKDPAAIAAAWPHLGSQDPFIRHAARVAIESQDPELWTARALEERNLPGLLNALVAVARCADTGTQPALLETLAQAGDTAKSEIEQLDILRILQLALIRMGKPEESICQTIRERLLAFYPSPSARLNQELCTLLVFLQEPEVVPRSLARIAEAPTHEEQVFLAFALRNFTNKWSDEHLKGWFTWCNKAIREYRGGVSFAKYLENARREMLDRLPTGERAAMSALGAQPVAAVEPPKQRELVREWKLEELSPLLAQLEKHRNLTPGRAIFAQQCAVCHHFANDGAMIGPDLTSVASRFGPRELLENILSPSLIISDRYATVSVTRLDGEEVSGMVIEETPDKLLIQSNPLNPVITEVLRADIKTRSVSKVSLMPEGLLNYFTKEEILDLLAFLVSGGPGPAPLDQTNR